MPAPLLLNFYSPTDELLKTYSRNGTPAGVMRKVMDLFGDVDGKAPVEIQANKELLDNLASVIVELYGDQFTMDELYKQSYFDEWFPLIMQIMQRAQTVQQKYSPTSLQQKQSRK